MRAIAIVFTAALLVAASMLAGCVGGSEQRPSGGGSSGGVPPATPEPRRAGLTERADGRIEALGRLARVDLEGGFWAIVGSDGTTEGASKIVAVIANADAWGRELAELEGSLVVAVGRRFEGASVRMAGPEIVIEELHEAGSVPGKPK